MIRTLLATTALTALMAGGALAQSTTTETQTNPMGGAIFNPESTMGIDATNGYFPGAPGQILASSLLGKSVYNSSNPDAEVIGDVNDVVMSPDGRAQAVVIGVGGFLGIGEKEVAIDFSRVTWAEVATGSAMAPNTTTTPGATPAAGTAAEPAPANNAAANVQTEQRLVVDATPEELESAPAFDRSAIEDDHAMMQTDTNTTMMGGTTGNKADATANTQGDIAATTQPNADGAMHTPREGMEIVDTAGLSADKLIGTRVYGNEDEDLGEIGDVIVSADGNVEAYIIDVGGFLGLGEKPVALDAAELDIMRDADGNLSIYTGFNEEQLKSQPEYSEEAYQENRDGVVLR